jgi:hypothetical protein
MRSRLHLDLEREAIAADHPTRRMQNVDVTSTRRLRVKRPLHAQRPVMAALHELSSTFGRHEAKRKGRIPTRRRFTIKHAAV